MSPEVALYYVLLICACLPSYLSCPVNSRQGQRDILGTWMWCTCMSPYCVVVGAVSVVESPGSCREGAGSIPTGRMALLPKRRRGEDEAGGSECPTAVARKPARAAGAACRRGRWCVFSWTVGGQGCVPKNREAHLPRSAVLLS